MSPLPAYRVGAGAHLAVNDDACTRAGAENHAEDDVRTRAGAVCRLRQCEAVGIVGEPDWSIEESREIAVADVADRDRALSWSGQPRASA